MPKFPLLPSGSSGLHLQVNYDAFYDPIGLVTQLGLDGVTILPVDFTGFQHIEVQVRANIGDLLPLVVFNDTLGTLIFDTNRLLGKFKFQVPVITINHLLPGFYVYDLYITDSLGRAKKWTAGNFEVVPRGTIK